MYHMLALVSVPNPAPPNTSLSIKPCCGLIYVHTSTKISQQILAGTCRVNNTDSPTPGVVGTTGNFRTVMLNVL